jgi:hypothetical protein
MLTERGLGTIADQRLPVLKDACLFLFLLDSPCQFNLIPFRRAVLYQPSGHGSHKPAAITCFSLFF